MMKQGKTGKIEGSKIGTFDEQADLLSFRAAWMNGYPETILLQCKKCGHLGVWATENGAYGCSGCGEEYDGKVPSEEAEGGH